MIGDVNVTELADRTGIEPRRLRYAVDHGIAPARNSRRLSPGRGVARSLTEEEALAVSLSALLLTAGLSRDYVIAFLRDFARREVAGRQPVSRGLQGLQEIALADGRYASLRGSGAEQGWRDLRDGSPAPEGYRPLVMGRINVQELRRRIRNEAGQGSTI